MTQYKRIGWREWLNESPNVLVDEPPMSAENLSTDIQTLRQKIIDHLPIEHGQKSYLFKLRYKTIKVQTNLALEAIPTANIAEPDALTYATVSTLQENVEKCLTATAGEEDQAIDISLVALAAWLKRYNSENEARTINKLFFIDASKVYTLLSNSNQKVEQPDPTKKKNRKALERDMEEGGQPQW